MKVLVTITENVFNKTMNEYKQANATDYYTVGEGAYNRSKKVDTSVIWEPLKRFLSIAGYGAWHIKNGYTIMETGCMYRTCNGNTWGVYKDIDGKHYGFFSGFRSMVQHTPFPSNSPVIEYHTTGPSDMTWHQTEYDYCLNQGYDYALKRMSQELIDNSCDVFDMTVSETFKHLYSTFVRNGKDVQNDIRRLMFESAADAEAYILKVYRNRVFDAAYLQGKEAVAWNMLSEEVRERILKWS